MKQLFQTLSDLLTVGNELTIVIRKNEDGSMTASALVKNESVKDEAKKNIIPMVVTGTPAELDEEFLDSITGPVEKTIGIHTNMSDFEKAEEQALAKSKAAAKKEAEEKKVEKAATDSISEAKKLADDEKYEEAVNVLKKAVSKAPESMKADMEKLVIEYQSNIAPDIFKQQ